MFRIVYFIIILLCVSAHSETINNNLKPAVTAVIQINEIINYQNYPVTVKHLIQNAYLLSKKNLTYQYGSAEPTNKGMDCSGTMYYLLREEKIMDVPRDANGIFIWVKQNGKLQPVNSHDFSSPEFSALKPGDLLFWSGTYSTVKSNTISHVMIYLGKDKNGKRLMFGSSDGRTYEDKKMWGVSVFDFKLPSAKDKAKFVGYSCIPQLTC